MLPSAIEDESQLLLSIIEYEMGKTDWPGGMQVSYNNGPFPQAVERSSNGDGNVSDNDDGLSSGAVAGIVIGVLALVGIIAVSAIFYIRNENEQKELFERQNQATKTVPFGSMDHQQHHANSHLYHSHDGEQYHQGTHGHSNNDYESDSDSSESSGSGSSEDDDTSVSSFPRSIEGEGKSLVSGDTFPTTAAQAKPQDIEDDGGYASSSGSSNDDGNEDDESYSSSESDSEVMMEQQMDRDNNLRKLQQSAASDEHAPIYEDQGGYNGSYGDMNEGYDAGRDYGQDQGGEGYEEGYGEGSGNYNVQQDESDYDVGQYQQQQHQHEQDNIHHSYPPQKYAGNGIESANDDQGDTVSLGSMNSADPPGQSYRDLPQPPQEDEHWTHPQQAAVPKPHQLRNNDIGYFDETAFQVYENEITGGGLHDSYHSSGSHHLDVDNHSNPGSYHSNQSHSSHHSAFDGGSNRSHHSQGSRQSIRSNSNRSVHSQGSRHSANSHHSSHSQNAVEPQQQHQDQYGQYVDKRAGSFDNNNSNNHQVYADDGNQNYMEGQHYTNNVNTHNQGYNFPPMPFDDGNEYQQQQQYNMKNDMVPDHHGQFGNNAVGTQYNNSSTLPQINTEVYHDQYGRGGGTNDGFDEASYHSFNPIGGSSSTGHHHRPEELDEVSNAGSAYTAKTRQVSNTSSSNEYEQGGYSAANSNIPTNQRQGPYGEEEEESITNIFKSLSEIQTRLASKGKEQPLNTTNDFEPMDYRSTGSWKEGVVEDGELLND